LAALYEACSDPFEFTVRAVHNAAGVIRTIPPRFLSSSCSLLFACERGGLEVGKADPSRARH
jgi:hypothetical protein